MSQLKNSSILNNGAFQIRNVLGQGGFGITYLATYSRTGKSVAVKEFFPKDYCKRDGVTGYVTMLRPEMEKYKRKFISEANKIAQLNHKGIIKVIEVFEENGTAYYAMEYIAGQSLFEILKQRRFTLDESLKIIEKVSKALAHIHSKRMLHLDIKPMNIMMRSSDKEPIIIDFGISKTYDAQGNPNTTFLPAASPGYSPAEQFEGEVNSFAPQLDIYSLGATLYSLITGKIPPYPTPLTTQKLSFEGAVPDYVIDAVKKAMAYRQTDRFSTVKEFLSALKLGTQKSSSSDKPIIKLFQLKSSSPYYLNDKIELFWNIQNADNVYLNGKPQDGLRKSKIIKYNSLGKKRLTLKAVKDDAEVSRTINFEILPKLVDSSQQESTRVILADIASEDEPVINFFKRSGSDKVYVGDEVSVYWQVKGADTITINGEQVPKTSKKKLVKVHNAGENAITLTATNSAGTVKKCVNLTVHQRQLPRIIQFDATKKSNIRIGESVKLMWNVEDCYQVRLGRKEIVPAKGFRLVAFQDGGSYAYTLHATNQYGSESKTIYILVNSSSNGPISNNDSESDSKQKDLDKKNNLGCLSMVGILFLYGLISAIGIWIVAILMPSHPTTVDWILGAIGLLTSMFVPIYMMIKRG